MMEYRLAKCCAPREGDEIVGFLKQDAEIFSVHRADCANIGKVPADRMVALHWADIAADREPATPELPNDVFAQLDATDFSILAHHREMGVDYAAVVARRTGIGRGEVFARHRKLRNLGLLRRVEPRMIQYRKGIVDGKWIKHRNHSYYELTELGSQALERQVIRGE
jgi:hypothetical protein